LARYLPRFNHRFSHPPAQTGSAYRPRLSLAQANEQVHFTYWRTVANDHTISLFGHVIALPPLPVRLNLAGRRVALHHRMDGRLRSFTNNRSWASSSRPSWVRPAWNSLCRPPNLCPGPHLSS
jgi:hypothetical protein